MFYLTDKICKHYSVKYYYNYNNTLLNTAYIFYQLNKTF